VGNAEENQVGQIFRRNNALVYKYLGETIVSAYNGLVLYDKIEGKVISYDDLPITNPFRTTAEGFIGGTFVQKLFLHNDNPSLYFTDISIRIIDNSSGGIYIAKSTWSWKLIYATYEPVPEEWDQITKDNTLSFLSIGSTVEADTYNYYPIWIQWKIPSGLAAQNIEELFPRVSGDQKLVGF